MPRAAVAPQKSHRLVAQPGDDFVAECLTRTLVGEHHDTALKNPPVLFLHRNPVFAGTLLIHLPSF